MLCSVFIVRVCVVFVSFRVRSLCYIHCVCSMCAVFVVFLCFCCVCAVCSVNSCRTFENIAFGPRFTADGGERVTYFLFLQHFVGHITGIVANYDKKVGDIYRG